MKRLTRLQIDHLSTRANDLIAKIADKQIEALGPAPKVSAFSYGEMAEMVRKGKAILKDKDAADFMYTRFFDAFIFPKTKQMLRQENDFAEYTKKVEKIRQNAAEKYKNFVDEIVLGDSDVALNMLKDLEHTLENQKQISTAAKQPKRTPRKRT